MNTSRQPYMHTHTYISIHKSSCLTPSFRHQGGQLQLELGRHADRVRGAYCERRAVSGEWFAV